MFCIDLFFIFFSLISLMKIFLPQVNFSHQKICVLLYQCINYLYLLVITHILHACVQCGTFQTTAIRYGSLYDPLPQKIWSNFVKRIKENDKYLLFSHLFQGIFIKRRNYYPSGYPSSYLSGYLVLPVLPSLTAVQFH